MSEQQNNMTVWQRLSQTFGPNAQLNQDYPTFKFDKKELLRTKSKEEYEKEKLQAQQTYYLTTHLILTLTYQCGQETLVSMVIILFI